MQQRYYDPVAGRFLSVDPVTTDAATGSSFNRYNYANNNPYKYTDPDGRFANFAWGALVGGGIELGFQLAAGNGVNWTSVGVAAGVGALTGGFGGVASNMATRGTISAGQAVAATASVGGAAAAAGKNAEAGLTGNPVTSKEVAISAATGAAGAGVGAKLATKMIGAAEKAAASSNNVTSGIGKNTLGAIREGGATSSVTTGASAVTQKGADVATGATGKEIENRTK
jgi:uncharacterized protein RhaS with RHS repeats